MRAHLIRHPAISRSSAYYIQQTNASLEFNMDDLQGNRPQFELSPDELLNELTDKDASVEIVGYVHDIFRPQEVGQVKKYMLFKFILGCGTGGLKKILCLIWGNELIQQYQHEITAQKILHIDGAFCKAVILSQSKVEDNFVPFELIIQKTTIVQFGGVYGQQTEQEVNPTLVNFEDVHHANGLVVVKGFLKMQFVAQTNRYNTATYGSGSIIDGVRKINVTVANFSPIAIEKGQAVIVTGEINDKNGFITITCKDNSGVVVDTEENRIMTSQELMRGVRTPKRQLPPAS